MASQIYRTCYVLTPNNNAKHYLDSPKNNSNKPSTSPKISPFSSYQTSTLKVPPPSSFTNRQVTGDKIVTPGAIVQLVFTTRLATEKDYTKATSLISTGDSSSEDSDIEEDNVDILIGRKTSHNDGDPVPIPLVHAPHFPLVPYPHAQC